MKTAIRFISIILAALFVLTAAVSCAEPADRDDEESKSSATDGTTEPVTDLVTTKEYDIGSVVPEDVKFEGQEIRIISRKSDWVKDELTIEEGYSGGVSDSVYERQMAVEARLGVEIVNDMRDGNNYVVTTQIKTDRSAGLYNFDIIANSVYSTIMYTGDGIMRDLGDCQYLDLTRPYWSQGFNDVASIGNAQYMCTGAAALTIFRYMFVTMFNKQLVADHDNINLYDVVNNGEWTLQYQLDMCQKYADPNNDSLKENGVYGFVSTNQAYIDPYWSSCDIPILKKDSDNWFVYSLDTDKVATTVDRLLNLYSKTNLGTYIYTSTTDAADQQVTASHFAADRAATATLRLVSVESSEIRDMKSQYGVIPMPKYNKKQAEYHTFLHDQFTAFGVYALAPEEKLPMIGAFLDVLAAKSYEIVMPAYYELALKNRYLQDEESAAMLDMMYENIYIDGGVLYTKKIMLDSTYGVSQQMRWFIRNNSNTVSSVYGQKEEMLKGQLETLQTAIRELQEQTSAS